MSFQCIVAMVKPNLTDEVVQAAKQCCSTGATIIPASGTGVHEAQTFFGLTLDVRTDVILFLVPETDTDTVLSAVERAGCFNEPGTGVAFVLDVAKVTGLGNHKPNTADSETPKS